MVSLQSPIVANLASMGKEGVKPSEVFLQPLKVDDHNGAPADGRGPLRPILSQRKQP